MGLGETLHFMIVGREMFCRLRLNTVLLSLTLPHWPTGRGFLPSPDYGVKQCSSTWQYLAICGSTWQYVAVSGSTWQYVALLFKYNFIYSFTVEIQYSTIVRSCSSCVLPHWLGRRQVAPLLL